MPNATAPRDPRVKPLRRVYTVDRYGTVTEPRRSEPVAVPR